MSRNIYMTMMIKNPNEISMYKYAPGLHGLLICFVMLGTACDQKPVAQTEQADQAQARVVVASVNGEDLYQDELDAMLQQYQ
jgi:hypothetical protein